jgi:hypothetical protein
MRHISSSILFLAGAACQLDRLYFGLSTEALVLRPSFAKQLWGVSFQI